MIFNPFTQSAELMSELVESGDKQRTLVVQMNVPTTRKAVKHYGPSFRQNHKNLGVEGGKRKN